MTPEGLHQITRTTCLRGFIGTGFKLGMEVAGGYICFAAHSLHWIPLLRIPVTQFTLGRGSGLVVLAIGRSNPSEETGYACSITLIVRFHYAFTTQHSTHCFMKAL